MHHLYILHALLKWSQRCSWLPVDTLATAILELPGTPTTSSTPLGSDIRDPFIFYDIVNPHVFSWEDFLSELHAGGLELSPVSFNNWRQMLQKSVAQGEEIHNPEVKLIEYFEKSYGGVEGFERKIITFRLRQRKGPVQC